VERCYVVWPALLSMTFRRVSTSEPVFGALKSDLFVIQTNLFPAKANRSATQSVSFVTPPVVCVTNTTFFQAPMFFIAAKNIVGALPAIGVPAKYFNNGRTKYF
jgi:hypothetical protein